VLRSAPYGIEDHVFQVALFHLKGDDWPDPRVRLPDGYVCAIEPALGLATNPDPDGKRTEARLRRLAERKGVMLQKSRRQPLHGAFFVIDPSTNGLLSSEYGMTLDEVSVWLSIR